jgi:hypothetical protein
MQRKYMKTINIWLDNPLNDATAFYVDLLEQATLKAGFHAVRVTSLQKASQAEFAITLHAKATCQILRRNPRAKVVTWFQGIVPEEAMMWQGKRLPNRVYKLAWEFFERIALRMSRVCLFVSEAMHIHYRNKYGLEPKLYEVIPCFNKPLLASAFYYEEKYTHPSFVYAGGLDRWQCIDEMLFLFKKIQQQLPDASLTILSSQQELALELLKKNEIRNSKVSYIPLAQLDQELQKYKYGFLLRAEHPINNVATPTKMNTYLACGIIPIYTSAVRDFETRLGHLPYSIKARNPLDEGVVSSVIENEKREIIAADLIHSYEAVFASYYSKEKYVNDLATKLAQLAH